MDEKDRLELEEEISIREDELRVAFWQFLEVVMESDADRLYNLNSDEITDILSDVIDVIADKHYLPVYRPVIRDGEDGEIEYIEYPYERLW